MKRSALSIIIKRNSLFEEGMRRIRNLDVGSYVSEGHQVLGEYMNCLKFSGYNQEFRFDILKGILDRKAQMDAQFESGTPRYRNKDEIAIAKSNKKGKYNNTWFLRGNITTIMKVQATSWGLLGQGVREKVRGILGPDGGETKVIEMAGAGIQAGIYKPDPFLSNGCHFETVCPIDPKGNCWDSRVIYALECAVCPATYVGTTAHTLHKRGLEHDKAVRRGDSSNGMAKHYINEHPEVYRRVTQIGYSQLKL